MTATAASTDPVARLARAADALDAHRDPDLGAVAAGIRRWLSGKDPTLDDALAAKASPGQRRPVTLARLAERDQLLRTAATRFYPGRPAADQARRLACAIASYENTAWRRERGQDVCPARHRGTVRETAFAVLSRGRAPGERRLRQILVATSSPYSLPAGRAMSREST